MKTYLERIMRMNLKTVRRATANIQTMSKKCPTIINMTISTATTAGLIVRIILITRIKILRGLAFKNQTRSKRRKRKENVIR